ncbi:NYN domain-containing protein [Candidatus Peregrinibacteria bacterium]|nr:NYN domain-containing protein [Candidatus Peregrinibacteria bacterium]
MKENNYAFIDAQNLNLSIRQLGWKLDYRKFRSYLKEQYQISRAFLFIGFVKENGELYKTLTSAGFTCVYKPTVIQNGLIKGNCDAELVLQALLESKNYNKAVLVTGDGDFHCLAKHLLREKKLAKLLIPNQKAYSFLLKRFPSGTMAFISDLKKKLSAIEKPSQR